MINESDFQPQEFTALRFERMKQAMMQTIDPQRAFRGYCLSGRDLDECMLIATLLTRFWNKHREECRCEGREMPPFVDDGPVHDEMFSRFPEQVPECFTRFLGDMATVSGGFGRLSEVQRRQVGPAPAMRYAEEDHLRLVSLVGEEQALRCERFCAIAKAPVDFARLLVDLATGENPPFQLEDTLEEKTHAYFDYCLNPAAKSTANNVRHCIEKVCIQRGLTPPKKRHRAKEGAKKTKKKS